MLKWWRKQSCLTLQDRKDQKIMHAGRLKHVTERETTPRWDAHWTFQKKKLLDMIFGALDCFVRIMDGGSLCSHRRLAAFDILPAPADRLWRHSFAYFVCLYDTKSLHPLSFHRFVPITPAMSRLGDRTPKLHPSVHLGVQGLAQRVCERQRAFHDAVVLVQ